MNKEHIFKTSLSNLIAFSYILYSAADLKNRKNTFFFSVCVFLIKPNSDFG
jgi:hypothetical protein